MLSRYSLDIFVLHKYLTSYDAFTSSCMGSTKTKQASHIIQYNYPFASTHMVNTQLLRVQTVHTKYRKYFRGFLNSRLQNFAQNPRKLMCREYFHFYSIGKHPMYMPTSHFTPSVTTPPSPYTLTPIPINRHTQVDGQTHFTEWYKARKKKKISTSFIVWMN